MRPRHFIALSWNRRCSTIIDVSFIDDSLCWLQITRVETTSVTCPSCHNALAYVGKSHWLDTHTGRYEPACGVCHDEGCVEFAVILDSLILGFLITRKLKAKFGEDKVERGVRWYAAMRALQLRPLRLPKPQAKRGQYPS